MVNYSLIILSILLEGSWGVDYNAFPKDFMFGAATSANQIEGAWNLGGRTESMWDHVLHTRPELISDRTNADISCDSYHLWKRDIEMVKEMGLNSYRFSISWPRLLPNGFSNYINEEGKKYYSDLLDGLLQNGIEPIVTLYHTDLPQSLQDLGGWANPLIVDWYVDYTRVVFSLYADRVKLWITLNEPLIMCDIGYSEYSVPFLDDTTLGMYLCNKYTLMAHAKAWRLYDQEFRPRYFGKLSIANLFFWFDALTPEDEEAASLAIDFWDGRYSHPIYSKEGGWPAKIEKILAENSKKEGYPTPRLIPFTPEEIDLVRGTFDYYALNHYTTKKARKVRPGEETGAWPLFGAPELGVAFSSPPGSETTAAYWMTVYPEGLRRQLVYLNKTYGPIDILITENGYPSLDLSIDDPKRVDYIKTHLEMVLSAINDGVNVLGYTVWSLMDNFEWLDGFSSSFGLYAVNFSDPMRKRTPRSSAKFYSSVARTRTLDSVYIQSLIEGQNYY